ncbi:MAG: hypothetical protein M3P18_14405 [Actinomycetota bacterium]|nr:hypothetical protein [Actinomycetota bacterium]
MSDVRPSHRRRGCIWWVGIAALAVAVLIVGAFAYLRTTNRPVSPEDRRRAVAKVQTAADGKAVNVTCAATSAMAVCLVTVHVPEPLDACQDWSVEVHDHFVSKPRWLLTRNC